MERDTVGKIASDLMQKQPETNSPIDLQRSMTSGYIANLIECVDRFKKDSSGDFYVVIITKNERLLANVFRNYFTARFSCPTPDYDQTVYKYNRKKDELEYLWTIPSKDACYYLLNNALLVDKSERDLLKFVMEFSSGDLYKKAKKLNGEKESSSEVEK